MIKIPVIEVETKFKTGWIGDDLSEPKIKITRMSADWYELHGLPNPSNPEQIVEHREAKEKERQQKKEEDFWKEVEKNIKFTTEQVVVENDKFLPWDGVTPQCVDNFAAIKIGFQNA